MVGKVDGDEADSDSGGHVAGVVGAERHSRQGNKPGHCDHEPAETGVPRGEHSRGDDGEDRVARRHRPELAYAALPERPGVGDGVPVAGGDRVHAEWAQKHVGLAEHRAGAADEHLEAERQPRSDADRYEPVEEAAAVLGVEQPDREDDNECHASLAELLEHFELAADIAPDGEGGSGAACGDDVERPWIKLPEQDRGEQAVEGGEGPRASRIVDSPAVDRGPDRPDQVQHPNREREGVIMLPGDAEFVDRH